MGEWASRQRPRFTTLPTSRLHHSPHAFEETNMASGVFDDALIKHLWSTRRAAGDLQRPQPRAEVVRLRGGAGAGAGGARHHPARRGAGDRRQGEGRQRGHRGDRRRDPPHQAPAGAGAEGGREAVQGRCTASTSISGRPRRTCSTPATVLQMKEAHAIYLRDMKAHRPGALQACRDAQGDADGGALARRAGAAHHLRPQGGDLAVRDGAQLRAPAPARAARVRRRHGGRGRHAGVVRAAGAGTRASA